MVYHGIYIVSRNVRFMCDLW